jgi:hypothetical protein
MQSRTEGLSTACQEVYILQPHVFLLSPPAYLQAPAQFLEQMILPFAAENTAKYYSDNEELVNDIAAGYRKVIADLYEAGCRNLQLDDCSWGMLVDPMAKLFFDTERFGNNLIDI